MASRPGHTLGILAAKGLRHGAPQVIVRTDVRQRFVQGTEDEIMHQPAIAETDFVLGGVNIHVHRRRIHFQVQHEGRMTVVVQHVPVRLAHGVRHQAIPDDPAVDEEVLQVCLTAGEGWQRHPAPQPQACRFGIDEHGVVDELLPTEGTDTALLVERRFGRTQALHHALIVAQRKTGIEAAECLTTDTLFNMIEFGFFRAQEFPAGRGIEEQVTHFHGGAHRVRRR